MSSVNNESFPSKSYLLSEVNPVLAQRITCIKERIKEGSDPKIVGVFRDKMKELQQTTADRASVVTKVKGLTDNLKSLRDSIQKIQQAKMPTPTQTTKMVGSVSVTVTQNYAGVAAVRDAKLQELADKKENLEASIQQMNPVLSEIEKKMATLTHEIQELKKMGKDSEYLEALLREFKGDEIDQLDAKFANFICVRERFNSFVNDVRRPLLHFLIEGKKVFDISKLSDPSDQAITELVVKDLEKYHLSITDFYKVLEFFHQGGTTPGYELLTEQVSANGLAANGIGPGATVELKMEQGKLSKLISTAFYVISDPLVMTEDSLGIVEAQGKKQCTSVYDFDKGTVNLSIATIPFIKGEVAKINAERYLKAPSKE